jgi:hypothetical protein
VERAAVDGNRMMAAVDHWNSPRHLAVGATPKASVYFEAPRCDQSPLGDVRIVESANAQPSHVNKQFLLLAAS